MCEYATYLEKQIQQSDFEDYVVDVEYNRGYMEVVGEPDLTTGASWHPLSREKTHIANRLKPEGWEATFARTQIVEKSAMESEYPV